jgi:hypothetical protein
VSSRKSIATCAANAAKHPGLLALDDEDRKALKKKEELALRHQAKAEEKKTNQARLHANIERIAVFEDTLSIQHVEKLANAARPATRASQTKKCDTPVSHTEAQASIILADLESHAQDLLSSHDLVESDASRADDKDYTPSCGSESEVVWPNVQIVLLIPRHTLRIKDINGNKEHVAPNGPKDCLKKAKHRETRAHIETHCQVKSSTGDMYLASMTSTTNNSKHKHDSDSEM